MKRLLLLTLALVLAGCVAPTPLVHVKYREEYSRIKACWLSDDDLRARAADYRASYPDAENVTIQWQADPYVQDTTVYANVSQSGTVVRCDPNNPFRCATGGCDEDGYIALKSSPQEEMTADEFRTRMELEPGFKDRVSSFDFL